MIGGVLLTSWLILCEVEELGWDGELDDVDKKMIERLTNRLFINRQPCHPVSQHSFTLYKHSSPMKMAFSTLPDL